jgi:hypothetical protein
VGTVNRIAEGTLATRNAWKPGDDSEDNAQLLDVFDVASRNTCIRHIGA